MAARGIKVPIETRFAGVIGEVSGLVVVPVVLTPVVLTPLLPVAGIRMLLTMIVAMPGPWMTRS